MMTIEKVVAFIFIVLLLALFAANRPKAEPPPDIEALKRAEEKRQRKNRKRMGGKIVPDVLAGMLAAMSLVLFGLGLGGIAIAARNKEPITLKANEWICSRSAVLPLETEPVCIQYTRKEHV